MTSCLEAQMDENSDKKIVDDSVKDDKDSDDNSKNKVNDNDNKNKTSSPNDNNNAENDNNFTREPYSSNQTEGNEDDDVFVEDIKTNEAEQSRPDVADPKGAELDSKVEKARPDSCQEKSELSATEAFKTTEKADESKESSMNSNELPQQDQQQQQQRQQQRQEQKEEVGEKSERAESKAPCRRKTSDKTSKKDQGSKGKSFSRSSTTSSDVDSNRKDSSSGEFKFLPDGRNKLELMDSTYGPGIIKLKSGKHLESSSSSARSSTSFRGGSGTAGSGGVGLDFPPARIIASCSHSIRRKPHSTLDCRSPEATPTHFVTCKCHHLKRPSGRSKSSAATTWHKLISCQSDNQSVKQGHSAVHHESGDGQERARGGDDDDVEDDDDDNRNEEEEEEEMGERGVQDQQQQYVVNVHVNPGETFSVCVSDQVQLIQGPATVRMVSNSGPPLPMPMQVPPGHMVQQIIDENGILTNVILSSQPPGLSAPPVVVGYYGNPSGSPHHHHVYPQFGAPYSSYPSHYPVHHHHMHHHVGQQRMCNASPNSLHHCNHQPPQPPSLPHNLLNSPHFYPPNVLPPPPSHHHHHHQFSSNHLEERYAGRGFKSRPPNSRSFVKFKDNNLMRSDHHHQHHPVYFGPPHPLPPPPHLHPGHPPPHRLPLPPYLRGAVPLKVNSNGRPRSLSTSSEDQELEEERQAIKEALSRITPPKIVETGSRYALILLTPPETNHQDVEIGFTEFVYELHLSERDEAGFNSVYSGDATEITLRDLKPATVYYIRVLATLDSIAGTQSDSVSFTTTSCEPDVPQSPKLVSRTAGTLTLKWNAAVENGSAITAYILEYDEGKGDMNFTEVYKGLQRQFKLGGLNATTSYAFRLAAQNALGTSDFSRLVYHSTCGTAPSQPDPPMLSESFSTGLTVSWIRRPNDDHFTLMMADENEETKTFSTVYSGSGLSFNVQNLHRNSEYKFKLQASNEEGPSDWSDVVKYKTLPDKPSPCLNLRLEGEATPDSFTISWDLPKDDGGQEITHYLVQVNNGRSKTVKKCIVRRHEATDLSPGLVHSVKVASVNSVGCSEWGEELKIQTKCVAPGACCQPKLTGKPQGSSTSIKWTCPEENGGCATIRYEVCMEDVEEEAKTEVYNGVDESCNVTCMTPGRKYLFKVRAINSVGSGPWSEALEVASGALPPEAPNPPVVSCSSPHQAAVTWKEPASNGSPIVEYRLEWQQLESEFSQLYVGSELSAQVNGMLAASLYNFRVQAVNSMGCGPFSPATSCMTPPSHPGPITTIHASSTSNSIVLSWKEPLDNGSIITGYYLSIDERAVVPIDISGGLEHVIENLTPETVYKIRLQAVNAIGLGPFSSTLKIATHSPPPPPPLLECVATTYNSLKLKWRDAKIRLDMNSTIGGLTIGSSGQMSYCLEMLRESGEFQALYYGPGHCFKVTKLSELSEYQFRVCSSNQDGRGPFSEVFKFTTSKAPPPVIKSPKVAYITSEACTVEWPGLRTMGQDSMFYILQMQCAFGRDQTFKEIYRGPISSYRVTGLSPSSEYRLRVCAVRQSKESTNQELVGSFSQTTSFVTSALKLTGPSSAELVKASARSPSESGSSGLGLTDQQWAITLLVCFTLFAILVACLAQHFISRHQQQLSDGLGGESILSSASEPSIPSPITTTSEKRD